MEYHMTQNETLIGGDWRILRLHPVLGAVPAMEPYCETASA
jgi:hypothetical protein